MKIDIEKSKRNLDERVKVDTEMNSQEFDFDKWWKELSEEKKEIIREIVIARIKQLPDNLRLMIGWKPKLKSNNGFYANQTKSLII